MDTQSGEILRRAANAARDEWAGETTGPFKNAARIHLAVADLLDQIAKRSISNDLEHAERQQAIEVARAYLGGNDA